MNYYRKVSRLEDWIARVGARVALGFLTYVVSFIVAWVTVLFVFDFFNLDLGNIWIVTKYVLLTVPTASSLYAIILPDHFSRTVHAFLHAILIDRL